MPSVISAYQMACQEKGYQEDPAQRVAIQSLQRVHADLTARHNQKKHLWDRLKSSQPVKGLYMWGGVGRGKTFLMDLFYQSLPFRSKMRQHFNRFMQQLHKDLKAMEGHKDPLKVIAKNLSKKVSVICFDEFLVNDIADAMLLGGLFEALFAEGVSLVATSNVEPDHLYEGGLQREKFLPAIAALKANVQVLNVDSGVDHRGRDLTPKQRYYTPLKGQESFMQTHFCSLVTHECAETELEIAGRAIDAVKVGDHAVWFEFADICESPRGQADYIEIAERFNHVLISNIPQMSDAMDDYARRFISLVDEFYDSGKGLVLSATVPIERLYVGKRLAFEFQRTISRLNEMQSEEYCSN